MEQILFATANKGKVTSLAKGLKSYGLQIVQVKLDLPEIQANTIQEVAEQKARDAFALVKRPVIVLDAGFCFPSLNGCPGPYTKYFLQTSGLAGLIKLADLTDRRGYFQNILCYLSADQDMPLCFEEQIWGTISPNLQGEVTDEHWSAMSTIFLPDGYCKTLAEMNEYELLCWRSNRTPGLTYTEKFGSWYAKRA